MTTGTQMAAAGRGSRLLRAGAASLASRGIGIVATLVLTPIVIKGVGTEQYGAYATITSLAGVAVVTDLGIGGGLVARLAHALGRNDGASAQGLVSTAWWALSGLGLVLAAIVTCAGLVLPWPRLLGLPGLPAADAAASVVVFGIALGLGLPLGLGDRVLTATQRGTQAAGWSLLSSTVSLAATGLAAHLSGTLLAVIATASVTPRLFSALQTWVTMNRVCPDLRPRRDLVSGRAFRQLRTAGALFLVQGVAIAVAFESDMLVVSATLGAHEAAVYSVNMRIITLVGSLAVVTLGQVFPAFGEALAGGDMPWVTRTFRRLTLALAGYSAVASLTLLVVTPAFVGWWVGSDLVPPTSLLVGLVVWTAYTTLLIPANMLMNAALVIRIQIVLSLAMAALNLPLSIVLAHHLGVAGPVWGSVIAHVLVSLVPTIVITRRVLSGRHAVPVAT